MKESPLYPSRVPVLRHAFAIWRLMRRWLSRRELTVRMLGLPVSEGTADEPGVILLQIDGLSRAEFERALADGRLPYVRKLMRQERLTLHSLYSGQPATTPAVLGELFYGVRRAVPAFSFRDHRTGEVVQMVEPEIATRIQDELSGLGEGLLTGGSAYCDIYSGGAAESQFCPGSMRWSALDDAAVWKKAALILLNAVAVARIVGCLFLEVGRGLASLVSSPTGRREWKDELLFIPRRMIGNVLVRETTAIAAEADATRGLPIVHANFLGYDELAHRRGPGSRYAHRALRGIDRALQRIGNAALGSRRRSYRVWIMSDHGQETTAIYDQEHGRSLGEAVESLYVGSAAREQDSAPAADGAKSEPPKPLTVAIGPVGYIYWPHRITDEEIETLGPRLVSECRVPLVMARCRGDVQAWTAEGVCRMPDDAGRILSDNHPHLAEVARDMTDLLTHPDAGDFVVSGWRKEGQPLSFVAEHGAHGGPGPLETTGFVVLSADAHPPTNRTLRPELLRELVQRQLRPPSGEQLTPNENNIRPLRIVTYNVHSCIGLDGRLSPQRIARVLADLSPDVVALQELDVGRSRTGGADQAAAIAQALCMEMHFAPCMEVTGELYGNAVLSRLPMKLMKAERFPTLAATHEPRGALWVKVQQGTHTIDVITTHLGLTRSERLSQTERLLGPDWVRNPHCGPYVVLCGDLNAGPASPEYGRMASTLQDSQVAGGLQKPRRTWFSPFPLARLDHVFVSSSIDVQGTDLIATATARVASDHLPLVADLRLSEDREGRSQA